VKIDDLLKRALHLAPWRPAGHRAGRGRVIRALASDTTWWTDDVWVADSTPVECGRSRQTTKRSALGGWVHHGDCASHSRYFWGLRLHLVCTLQSLPVGFALAGAKADERRVLAGILVRLPPAGVIMRVLQRILALTATWHNDDTGQPVAVPQRPRPDQPPHYLPAWGRGRSGSPHMTPGNQDAWTSGGKSLIKSPRNIA
jgi:hypothetical protein